MQFNTLVAYLDEGAWEIASQIVDKMERGKMHDKAIPTSLTFRFLSGCKTSVEKRSAYWSTCVITNWKHAESTRKGHFMLMGKYRKRLTSRCLKLK